MEPDYSLPLYLTLVFGQGAIGKSSFCFRYMLNGGPFACRFIFDDRGQAAQRLGLKPCGTANECEAALATRWVCFNPHIAFPGAKLKDGFRWFCDWTYKASQRGPGRKIIMVDEIWQWTDAYSVPFELENIPRTGRAWGLELLTATHAPRDYHRDVRRLVTEWVGFNTKEPEDLKAVRPYFSAAALEKLQHLPRGHFIAVNRETGSELAAKIPGF
jgi:hypothetical protein